MTVWIALVAPEFLLYRHARRIRTAEDFALSHPGGSLGRRLLLHVHDIMHKDNAIPAVTRGASLRDALMEMTAKGLGMTAVVDD